MRQNESTEKEKVQKRKYENLGLLWINWVKKDSCWSKKIKMNGILKCWVIWEKVDCFLRKLDEKTNNEMLRINRSKKNWVSPHQKKNNRKEHYVNIPTSCIDFEQTWPTEGSFELFWFVLHAFNLLFNCGSCRHCEFCNRAGRTFKNYHFRKIARRQEEEINLLRQVQYHRLYGQMSLDF